MGLPILGQAEVGTLDGQQAVAIAIESMWMVDGGGDITIQTEVKKSPSERCGYLRWSSSSQNSYQSVSVQQNPIMNTL